MLILRGEFNEPYMAERFTTSGRVLETCLAFFVPLCSSACHVGVRRACCDTPGASLCLAMDGLAIPEVYSQA